MVVKQLKCDRCYNHEANYRLDIGWPGNNAYGLYCRQHALGLLFASRYVARVTPLRRHP
jgi:hypothetical protein